MAEKRTRLSDMTKAGRKAEKPTVIGAIRDPQFVRDVLQGLGETATRGITGVLGAPVDITTMAMRPFGYSVPAEQVVGGSEYLGKQLERAGMLSGNRNQLSELLAGLVTPDPLDVAKLGAMAVPVVGRAIDPATLKQLRTEAISAKDEFDDLYRAIKKRTREPEAEEYFGKSGAMHDAQERLAQSMSNIPDDAFGFQARNNDNMMLMLTPSAQKPGEYQLTRFDRKGQPFGHTEYKTKEHALKDFLYESNLRTVQDSGQYLPEFKTQAPRDEAMRIAQANAAKPISEGGLGLPPDNTAMDRAKAMGFDTPAFHATGADFEAFNPSAYRQASFFAGTPEGAMRGRAAGQGDLTAVGKSENIMPVMLRSEGIEGLSFTPKERQVLFDYQGTLTEQQVSDAMKKMGGSNWNAYFDEIELPSGEFVYQAKSGSKPYQDVRRTGRDVYGSSLPDYDTASAERFAADYAKNRGMKGFMQRDEGGLSLGITDPTQIRSRFAAFDPARRYESDLLGAADPRLLGAIGLGTAGAIYKTNREKEKDRKREK